jgi:hypothetical protein
MKANDGAANRCTILVVSAVADADVKNVDTSQDFACARAGALSSQRYHIRALRWGQFGKATKPRTVYEKAEQDFTETARRLARLNQHFRQATFAEFKMLMGLDDEY